MHFKLTYGHNLYQTHVHISKWCDIEIALFGIGAHTYVHEKDSGDVGLLMSYI